VPGFQTANVVISKRFETLRHIESERFINEQERYLAGSSARIGFGLSCIKLMM
jgi:hypothetical protein